MVELGLWRDYAQPKRNRHRPWCGDGAYALGLGVLKPHTMVGAKAAQHHPPRLISYYLAGKKKVSEQEFRRPHHNHLTSINSEIDRRDDGNVLVARELSDALRAKIRWGILTP